MDMVSRCAVVLPFMPSGGTAGGGCRGSVQADAPDRLNGSPEGRVLCERRQHNDVDRRHDAQALPFIGDDLVDPAAIL
jgi:hypothetical protein